MLLFPLLLEGEHYTWFAELVVCGQILLGLALIIGAFVGVAAFFGALMNWNFMMAGSASTNGTSLKHSHSQLVSIPVVPKDIERKYEVASSYYDDTSKCLYSELVREEMKVKERVVFQTDRFVVFHPYASRFPFETWIAPKEQGPAFGNVSDADLDDLAQVLKSTLWGLYTVLVNPDYNYVVHSGPVEKGHEDPYLWYIEIIPRLTKIAGFELGSGTAINTTLPEETAEFMRRARWPLSGTLQRL